MSERANPTPQHHSPHFIRRITVQTGILLTFLCATSLLAQTPPPPAPLTLAPGRFLTACPAPRLPLAADVSADGRAAFLAVDPGSHSIECDRMTATGKLRDGVRLRDNFGGAILAAVCGAFSGGQGKDTVAVLADGTVLVACDIAPDGKSYRQATTAATLPPALMPKSPIQAVVGDFDGDRKPDILLCGSDGKLLILHDVRTEAGVPRFAPMPVDGARLRGHRLAAGDLDGTGTADIVWIDDKGEVRRAGIAPDSHGSLRLVHTATLTTASPDDGLTIGHFSGGKMADVIVGQRLLPGGNVAQVLPLPNLPDAAAAKTDAAWLAADLNGDGKDDLIRVERSADRFEGDHVLVYYAHDASDKPELQFGDDDNDGLPDAWETGDIHPGGLDLKAMGCSPRHADVIVEVQPFADVPTAELHADIDKAIQYFASLPVKNPDGQPGIALHVIYREPIPLTDGHLNWPELAAKYHPANHRGITHWMEISNGGGGQSSMMNDAGSCGIHGMPAVFLHEFGHQLGLDHSGFWGPSSIPIYPSLMNYAYNYQLNGKAENVGYSDGRLAGLVFNEQHLSEYLPLTPDKVAFLAGPPYRYRMKPAPDGVGTLIDWNWNGIFGEKDITADINYGYSTSAGERHNLGRTYTAPALTTCGDGRKQKLLVLYGQLAPGAPMPAAEVKTPNPSLSMEHPGRLCLRVWQGADPRTEGGKWSDEIVVEPAGVTAEASAVTFGKATWIAYPTTSGITLRRLTLDASGTPKIDSAQAVPNTESAQPTLATLDGHLLLLLWRDAKTPVALRWLDVKDAQITPGPESALDFTSNVPVGAAEGKDTHGKPALWLGLTQNKAANLTSRWQVRCLTCDKGAWHSADPIWADGDRRGGSGEGRVTLLWERDKAFGPSGRWYFVQRGSVGGDLGQSLIGMRIADPTVNGGVLSRRYYDEWTNSRSAPAACWFLGDIALAMRWFGDAPGFKNDYLFVGFFGRGIDPEPMGDFDDLHEIRNYGLIGSISRVGE